MISTILIAGVIIAFIMAFTEPVTELPYGLEEPAVFLINMFNVIGNTMPWMETILTVFIIGVLVKVGLWVFDKFLIVLQIIRG